MTTGCPFDYFYSNYTQPPQEKNNYKKRKSQGDLPARRLLHLAQHARLRDIRHVNEDIVCWMTVQGSL